ncbi:MAG TPA: aminotransferase class V-fold PLP-dependent enzyme [Candidatus Dormibacteraeota bacterium]|nr:aminotransferase class V-fold PLP-dependent enzyme [Candidatus Dormibacteraeota bacterium]
MSRFRRHWALKKGIVFLNHGSFGACPKAIVELQTKLRREMEAEPVQFLWRRYEERLAPARKRVAKFVGASAKDLVFTTNATSGVNAVVRSLKLRPGDELLTTDHDYNACHNVLSETAGRTGARVVVAQLPFPLTTAEEVTAAILKAVTPRTRLALVDHVTSSTALIFPIERIVRELQMRRIEVLVDGAHAPGMLPLAINRLGATYYTANLHKWVCAPKGAAFLWVRKDKQESIQPPVISHGNNRPRPGFSRFQDRFDWVGTADPSAWFCAPDAIDWMGRLLPGGWPELRRRNRELVLQASRLLCERLNVEPPCPENMIGTMATLPLPQKFQGRAAKGKIDREQLALYDRFGIELPLFRIGKPERRYFRISAQIYNSLRDYEYLAECIEAL